MAEIKSKAESQSKLPPVILTGVKPTGMPHLGNYLGAMKPALDLAKKPGARSMLFIADYHSLTFVQDKAELSRIVYEVAASWIACGLDPEKTIFYRQSDVPEVFELSWILSCVAPKGLMNRAHAYKAKVAEAESAGKEDVDSSINMGLFTYPILMAADILLYRATHVPVGEDQLQHVEYARDIGQKFNRIFGSILTIPEAIVQMAELLPGIDGRKMSKSYGNHIPLFEDSAKLRKIVMKVKTDSLPPEAPKDPSTSLIFQMYRHFATADQIRELDERYRRGIGWGDAKQVLFEALDAHLKGPREIYADLMANKSKLEALLRNGQEQALEIARPMLKEVRQAIGVSQVVTK